MNLPLIVKFNIMINDLKGLEFHVFLVMCRSVSKNAKHIYREMIPKPNDHEEAKIWGLLQVNGYIKILKSLDGGSDCQITPKGEKILNCYNQFGKELLKKREYDFVISKFLNEKNGPVYSIDFPESILSRTVIYTKTDTKAEGLEEYLKYHSLNKLDFSVSNHLVELTISGKEKYEYQITLEENEKLHVENVSKLTYENLQLENEKLKIDLHDYPLVLEERKELKQKRSDLQKERKSLKLERNISIVINIILAIVALVSLVAQFKQK